MDGVCEESPDGEHSYDEDEDALEYVCTYCWDRQPIPLDKLIR
jgi:hypothetical protein